MKTISRCNVLLLMLCICFSFLNDCHRQVSLAPELVFGPENGGLRMCLSIKTERSGGQDHFLIKVGIINNNNFNVTLVGDSDATREEFKDYADYLKWTISFLSFPTILPSLGQTMAPTMVAIQKVTIEPHQEYVVSWTTTGNSLKSRNNMLRSPYFRLPGLYGIRASMVFTTDENKKILLYSNEVQVSIGGSNKLPVIATGHVLYVDTLSKLVSIDLGAIHGVVVGDVFDCIESDGDWELKIVNVGEYRSEATSKGIEWKGPAPKSPYPPHNAGVELSTRCRSDRLIEKNNNY